MSGSPLVKYFLKFISTPFPAFKFHQNTLSSLLGPLERVNAFICKNSSGRASRETFVFLNNYKFKLKVKEKRNLNGTIG